MKYPDEIKGYEFLINDLVKYKTEMGADGIQDIVAKIKDMLNEYYEKINNLKTNVSKNTEPEDFEKIIKNAKITEVKEIDEEKYLNKLKGGMFGRFAGCALGAPLEFATAEQMETFANMLGMEFPPKDYWLDAPTAYIPRYKIGFAKEFTKGAMNSLSVDDDITYTFIAMLVMEKYGLDFTTLQVADIWQKYLPLECTFTAENSVLVNLNNGLQLPNATLHQNPSVNLIGGLIRCDGFAYVSPNNPRQAGYLAYKDSFLTHRNSGLYSSIYFAVVMSMAFSDLSIDEIFEKALDYIPENSNFYKVVKWTVSKIPEVKNYKDAVRLVGEKFEGMSIVHSENNSALIIFGCFIGKDDYEKGMTETVAMGFDNDCTGATVGSILGIYHGFDKIPQHWYLNWNNTARSYLDGIDQFDLQDVVERFNNIRKGRKML